MRFVRYYAEKFGIDENKIATIGSSAGGHLCAHLSTSLYEIEGEGVDEIDEKAFTPNAQILCYPVITGVDEEIKHKGSYNYLLGEGNEHLTEKVSPELLVSEKTPPAFIWHCCEDRAVNVRNSFVYASALSKFKIPVEMHIFPHGGHGLGLAKDNPRVTEKLGNHIGQWNELVINWLAYIDFMSL